MEWSGGATKPLAWEPFVGSLGGRQCGQRKGSTNVHQSLGEAFLRIELVASTLHSLGFTFDPKSPLIATHPHSPLCQSSRDGVVDAQRLQSGCAHSRSAQAKHDKPNVAHAAQGLCKPGMPVWQGLRRSLACEKTTFYWCTHAVAWPTAQRRPAHVLGCILRRRVTDKATCFALPSSPRLFAVSSKYAFTCSGLQCRQGTRADWPVAERHWRRALPLSPCASAESCSTQRTPAKTAENVLTTCGCTDCQHSKCSCAWPHRTSSTRFVNFAAAVGVLGAPSGGAAAKACLGS